MSADDSTTTPYTVTPTKFHGVYQISPRIFRDERGYFFESFKQDVLIPEIVERPFVQDNISFTKEAGTLRGLHFQQEPHAQAKLIMVLSGEVFDVIVDLRFESPTYGMWESFLLSEEKKNMLYIPRGFAHGFVTRTPNVLFAYKCDDYYEKSVESGIVWNDPTLNIDWKLEGEPILSEKDKALPAFTSHRT